MKIDVHKQLLPLPSTFNFSIQNLIFVRKSCKHAHEISQIHGLMVKSGADHDIFFTSKLLAASIHNIHYAASIFTHTQNPNLFMFNTMIRAYSISDDPKRAIHLFNKLRTQSLLLDQFSFITTLKACTRVLDLWTGQMVHGIVVKYGFLSFVNVKNAILHLYSVGGRVFEAQKVFDEMSERNDVVSWNTLMGGYAQVSKPYACVDLFKQMFSCGYQASDATLLYVMSGLGAFGDSLGGELIHGYCVKVGFLLFKNVETSLIEMYVEMGDVESGRRVFDGAVDKDVVMWNCMIGMYAKIGLEEEAVSLFQQMKVDRVKPNSSTLVSLVAACGDSKSTKVGQGLYDYAVAEGVELDAVLGTAFIDMFAKHGALDKAVDIFKSMQSKDVKTWSAMILSYGVHGHAIDAVRLFDEMEKEGIVPTGVTFLAVLCACSHGGLVKEAIDYFERMVRAYGLLPRLEHYGCVIDLLGRAGLLHEAHNLIKELPIKGDAIAWRALLAACRVYGDTELGESVKRDLDEIDAGHPTDEALFSGMFAIAERLPDYTRWQQITEEKRNTENRNKQSREKEKAVKVVGSSIIESDMPVSDEEVLA